VLRIIADQYSREPGPEDLSKFLDCERFKTLNPGPKMVFCDTSAISVSCSFPEACVATATFSASGTPLA